MKHSERKELIELWVGRLQAFLEDHRTDIREQVSPFNEGIRSVQVAALLMMLVDEGVLK